MNFRDVLRPCRSAAVGVLLFSAAINLLYLTGSFYMFQVYDRVLPSRSVPTLVAISILAVGLYTAQAVFDYCRSRILIRIGRFVEEALTLRTFRVVAKLPLTGRAGAQGLQPLRDLDQIRSFFGGGGVLGLLDIPWMPLYLAICFLLHPLIGFVALAGSISLIVIMLCSEVMTRTAMRNSARMDICRLSIAEDARRNSEVVYAMGMAGSLGSLWQNANRRNLDAQCQVADVAGGFSAVSKAARMALQSAVLGVGAYLVIQGSASAGVIIAGSILAARALAPVELVISNWKGFVGAVQSWSRLQALYEATPEASSTVLLPDPRSRLAVEAVSVTPPGSDRVVVSNVSFSLKAGDALGIIGPSASGKSSLARALVGVWRPASGCIRLDGASLEQWNPETLGRRVGYLPQDVELLDGTIAQNISRFDDAGDDEALFECAELAGLHDSVVHLPSGYDTRIGEGGLSLSGGQRQRVGLARALYRKPFLIVLDEPNSNLDADGEQALTRAIAAARAWGSIIIIIAHRPSALAGVDELLVMSAGVIRAVGPKEDVLRRVVHAVQR